MIRRVGRGVAIGGSVVIASGVLGMWLSIHCPASGGEKARDGTEWNLPDRNNPDYVYGEDFEEGKARDGSLPAFSIVKRNGVREGAGYESRYGYSNVIIGNNSLPPYPTVRFPKQAGPIFVHYNLKAPPNFYLGRANHGYYVYDSEGRGRGKLGSVTVDHATDHPAWFDPEWDPHTICVLRGSGYGRMVRSFEGFEPKRRGEWHSHQVMIIPSQKDPNVGRMKVWIDGELANFCKHDTIPCCDTFWISNYWHSREYVPKDTQSNLFEAHTSPPHPAFEIFLDNLIISEGFIEFGPNRFQVERIRFAGFQDTSFRVCFDTPVAAKTVGVRWGETENDLREAKSDAASPGHFHSLQVAGLKPGRRYVLRLSATDAKGRHYRRDFVMLLSAGEHTVVVEHTSYRYDDWEKGTSKFLAFRIEPEDKTPPRLLAQAIYNTQFHKPQEPPYGARWSEDCAITIDYGLTDAYGQTLGGGQNFTVRPALKFPLLELGKTYHYRVTAVDLMGNKTVLPDATFTIGDTIPPCKTLLAAERASDTQVRLKFKAPGEDANHSTAAAYDLRWSTKPLTIHDWNQATQVESLPKPNRAGTQEVITLDGFPRGKTYYFAVRAIDNHGLAGLLSNIASDPPGPEVMDCDGDGYGVGAPAGPDPDDYDASVPGK
jgi:hypothetical protein